MFFFLSKHFIAARKLSCVPNKSLMTVGKAARVCEFASVKTWYASTHCCCCCCCGYCKKKWIIKKSSENDLLNLFRKERERAKTMLNWPVMCYWEWVIKMRKSHVSYCFFCCCLSKVFLRVIFIDSLNLYHFPLHICITEPKKSSWFSVLFMITSIFSFFDI